MVEQCVYVYWIGWVVEVGVDFVGLYVVKFGQVVDIGIVDYGQGDLLYLKYFMKR